MHLLKMKKAFAIPLEKALALIGVRVCRWEISSHAKTFGINSKPNIGFFWGGECLLDKGYV